MDLQTLHREIRTCGRPTRAKTPCKQKTEYYIPACALHRTDEERELGRFLQRVYWEGYADGQAGNRETTAGEIKNLKTEILKLRNEKDARDRVYHDGAGQLVEVDGYAYRWVGDSPLEVGDYVMIPCSYVDEIQGRYGSKRGQVTALGTTYKGSLAVAHIRASPPEE